MGDNQNVELIASGFRWPEGPVWLKKQKKLLFSDVVADTIHQWTASDGVRVFLRNSGGYNKATENVPHYDRKYEPGSNGMTADKNEEYLFICQHALHRVLKIKISEVNVGDEIHSVTDAEELAPQYQDKPLNAPNDI